MPKNTGRKAPNFLDVADFVITQPYQPSPSPQYRPVPAQYNDVITFNNHLTSQCSQSDGFLILFHIIFQIQTPHNMPSVIEFQCSHMSPYLKQLLNNPEIQFHDFTLEGPQPEDFDSQECRYMDENPIPQEQAQQDRSEELGSVEILEEPYAEPSRLNLKTFKAIMAQFRNRNFTDEQIREFTFEYLTEEDLRKSSKKSTSQLIQIAQHNLRPCGLISWLQRRNKVNKYLQKKKRRVWNKKINYDCRKKVAENRLRIKGKFVTHEQACQMLGLDEGSNLGEIKKLLGEKYKG